MLLGRPVVVSRRGNSQCFLELWISSDGQELKEILCKLINKDLNKEQ